MLMLSHIVVAQNSDWIRADNAFAEGYYNEALDYYKKAIRKNKTNVELMFKAAESAQQCNDYKQAIKYYKQLMESTGGKAAYPEAIYKLATMYRFNNQHDSAIIIYADYLAQRKYRNLEFEQRALQEQEACKWVLEQRKDTTSKPYIYNITHVGKQINTKTKLNNRINIYEITGGM